MLIKENILFTEKYKIMNKERQRLFDAGYKNENKPLYYHNGYMYLPIAKSANTSIENLFNSIKNNESLHINMKKLEYFSKEYNQTLYEGCKNLKKFNLFFHVRDPWDRFISALCTDIRRSIEFKNKNDNKKQKFILERCEEVRDKFKFLDLDDYFYSEKNQQLTKIMFPPLIDIVSTNILLHIPPMKEKIKKIEIWNFKFIKESIEKNWNCKFLVKKNVTPTDLKNTVYNFFNKEKEFYKEWREKTNRDHKLYNTVKNVPCKEMSCKEYVKSFYIKKLLFNHYDCGYSSPLTLRAI